MKLNKNIYVVIPIYNDGSCIRQVIDSILQQGFQNIIIVDDGSEENIVKIIKNLPVYYIKHKVNLGQGAALQTGFDFAKEKNAAIVVTFDADGQHNASDIQALITPILSANFDVTLGSRFLENNHSAIPLKRRLVLRLARFINFCFCGLLLTDAHNGLRAFNRQALEKLEIEQNRMAHASEILFQIKLKKLRYKEVPTKIYYTTYSQLKGQKNLDGVAILFDLLLSKLFK